MVTNPDMLREMKLVWLEQYDMKEEDVKVDNKGEYIEVLENIYSGRDEDGHYALMDVKTHIIRLPEFN